MSEAMINLLVNKNVVDLKNEGIIANATKKDIIKALEIINGTKRSKSRMDLLLRELEYRKTNTQNKKMNKTKWYSEFAKEWNDMRKAAAILKEE